MIRYLLNHEIDKQEWDSCILGSQNGLVYGCSWYLDNVCPGWNALVEDNYSSVMPLPTRRKFGFDYIYRPAFTQQLGVFSPEKINEKKLSDFLNAIPDNYSYINFSANYSCNFDVEGFSFIKNKNYILDIKTLTYEEIYIKYSSNHKRNIKKAQSFQLKSQQGTLEELIAFKLKNNEKHVHLTAEQLDVFKKVAEKAIQKRHGEVICAYSSDNVLIAAVFLTIFRDHITYLMPVSSNKGKDERAMFFLIDDYIKNHLNQYLILDFEGSNIPNVAVFYEGFGATPEIYPTIFSNRLPWYVRFLK